MQPICYDENTVNTAALLNTYMYLDNSTAQNGSNIRDVLSSLKSRPEYGSPGGKYYENWELLNRAAQTSFGNLILDHQSESMGFPKQTNACTFTDPRSQDIFIVYRGTADGEWPDNGAGLFSTSTLQQEDAVQYFDRLAENGYLETSGSVYISGHSKGGNKAQFVTLASAYSDQIEQCLSFDGQGFAPKAIDALQELNGLNEYKKRRNKLISICGNNDFVNVLGCSAISPDHIFYIETEPGLLNPAGYHDIKYLFAQKDKQGRRVFGTKLNPQTESQGDLALYVSQLSSAIMELPEDKLADCAMALTKLIELGGEKRVGIHEGSVTSEEILGLLKYGISLIFSTLPSSPKTKLAAFSLPILAPTVLQGGALAWYLASTLDPFFSHFSQLSQNSDPHVFPNPISPDTLSGTPSIFLNFTQLSALPALLHESLLYLEQAHRQIAHIHPTQCKVARNHLKRLALELIQEAEQLKAAKDTLDNILTLYKQTEKTCSDSWLH